MDCVCVCVRACILKLCLTLCDPMDCSLPGPSVHGISQAKILEEMAVSSSRGSSRPRRGPHASCFCSIGRWILTAPPLCGSLSTQPGAASEVTAHPKAGTSVLGPRHTLLPFAKPRYVMVFFSSQELTFLELLF